MNKKWDSFYKQNGRFYLLPHPFVKDLVKLLKEADLYNVLDIGCGSGTNLIRFAEEGFDVTGLDFSVVAAHIAEEHLREKGLGGKVYTGDYLSAISHFTQEEFDLVVSINSLQYITDLEIFNNVIKEIKRVLSKHGFFFLVVPSQKSIIIEPKVEQMFWNPTKLEEVLSKEFNIEKSYVDENKYLVFLVSPK
jgi:SAM-dependent methyltransferase